MRMLTRVQRISYGIGRLGSSILLSLFSLASVYIYWEQFGLDPVLTGWANAIGKIVIAIAGFLMGYISDISNTRWGRRKPFVVIGAPLLALSFVLYFTPYYFIHLGDQFGLFVYAAVFNGLFHLSYAFLLTPFQSWMPEITEPSERVSVARIQNTSNLLSNAIGVMLSFSLPSILSNPYDWKFLALLIGLAAMEIFLYLPSLLFVPRDRKAPPKPDIVRELRIVISNPNYVKWLIAQGLVSVATVMITSIVLSYITAVLGIQGAFGTISFGIVLFVMMLIFFYTWGNLAKKYGKGKVLLISNSILALILPWTLVLGQVDLPVPTNVLAYAFIALGAVGLSGFQLFPYAIIADLAHEDEIKTGENRAGMYTGFNSIPLNVFQTLSYIITGYILSFPIIPQKGYSSGLIWWGPVCVVFVVLGSLMLSRTNVDPSLKDGSHSKA